MTQASIGERPIQIASNPPINADTPRPAAATMKRTWVNYGLFHDWADEEQGQGEVFLRKATEIKNIWIPYGE